VRIAVFMGEFEYGFEKTIRDVFEVEESVEEVR
jgi:hypothetical protein